MIGFEIITCLSLKQLAIPYLSCHYKRHYQNFFSRKHNSATRHKITERFGQDSNQAA